MITSFLKAKSYQRKADFTRTDFMRSSRGFARTNLAKQNLRGFTLIELLVVIAIIGILSSVVLASLNSARTKARDTRRVSDLKQIQVALELYYDANSKYPTNLTALVGGGNGASLSVLPTDPRGVGNGTNEGNGYKYAINNATTPTIYHLGAVLEQTAGQTTLEENDLDGDSTTVSWPTVTTSSVPFSGADMVYDLSNTKFNP